MLDVVTFCSFQQAPLQRKRAGDHFTADSASPFWHDPWRTSLLICLTYQVPVRYRTHRYRTVVRYRRYMVCEWSSCSIRRWSGFPPWDGARCVTHETKTILPFFINCKRITVPYMHCSATRPVNQSIGQSVNRSINHHPHRQPFLMQNSARMVV
jgi:hypothetical protein